jgi:hypothetical protein
MVGLGNRRIGLCSANGYLMDNLPSDYHPHDADFLDHKIHAMPYRFQSPIAKRYSQIFKKQGRRDANLNLLRSIEQMPKSTAVRLAGSDSELVAYADKKAAECSSLKHRYGEQAYDDLMGYVACHGIDPPEIKKAVTITSALERVCDALWWRRALRKKYGRAVEKAARDVGLVHKGAGIYSSDETLYRRKQQKSRNRLMLDEIIAVNEAGQEYTLAELSELSVSNPTIRRGELMTRIAGFETVANDLNHKALFVTLTCPSRFHSHTIKHKTSIENPQYDGSTPRQAQAYLQNVWARIRAKLARHGLTLYGFRVAEPNHDGCVHWHLLVFAPGWALRRIRQTFLFYGLADSPGEPGAKKHRVTFVEIDPSMGTAAGYIAKYIAKNIDGFALDRDLFGGCQFDAAARVEAWASCWGIRQFQQLGGPPVTVWRELRRIEGEESGVLETARDAADRGDWAAFVAAMGGPTCSRQSRPIRLAKATDLIDIDTATGEILRASPVVNRYGEPAAAQVIGVAVGHQVTATRWHHWELITHGNKSAGSVLQGYEGNGVIKSGGGMVVDQPATQRLGEQQMGLGLSRNAGKPLCGCEGEFLTTYGLAPPWSSVNNCTSKSELMVGDRGGGTSAAQP